MSLTVIPLDLSDDATLAQLVALQRAGYAVEAELIGAPSLPPLRETPERLRASGERFLGGLRTGRLVGAVSYRRWTVGTGAANAPARALYERRGFRPVEQRIVPGGVEWVRMERP